MLQSILPILETILLILPILIFFGMGGCPNRTLLLLFNIRIVKPDLTSRKRIIKCIKLKFITKKWDFFNCFLNQIFRVFKHLQLYKYTFILMNTTINTTFKNDYFFNNKMQKKNPLIGTKIIHFLKFNFNLLNVFLFLTHKWHFISSMLYLTLLFYTLY